MAFEYQNLREVKVHGLYYDSVEGIGVSTKGHIVSFINWRRKLEQVKKLKG